MIQTLPGSQSSMILYTFATKHFQNDPKQVLAQPQFEPMKMSPLNKYYFDKVTLLINMTLITTRILIILHTLISKIW